MENKICLDTAFIIDLLKNKKEAIDKYQELKNNFFVTTQINVYEIKAGIHRRLQEHIINRELLEFNKFLFNLPVIKLNEESIDESSKINGGLTKAGNIIEDLDILIAGICLTNNCNKIITKNEKHFERIKNLKIISY